VRNQKSLGVLAEHHVAVLHDGAWIDMKTSHSGARLSLESQKPGSQLRTKSLVPDPTRIPQTPLEAVHESAATTGAQLGQQFSGFIKGAAPGRANELASQ
jgi:hypothetical protein